MWVCSIAFPSIIKTKYMKKYITILLFLLSPLSVVYGQTNLKAMEQALAEVLHKYSVQADTVANRLSEKFSKRPDYQVAIARSYYRNQNRSKANVFLGKALKLNSHFAPAFLLQGDMAAFDRDTMKALTCYQQAIEADGKNIEAYQRYVETAAHSHPKEAIAMLEKMGKALPGVNTELSQAFILFSNSQFHQAAEQYARVDSAKMDEDNLWRYAFALYFDNRYEESSRVALQGLKKYPSQPRLHRVLLYDGVQLKKYQEAYDHGCQFRALQQKADGLKLNVLDYVYQVSASNGIRNYDESMRTFAEFLNNDSTWDSEDRKTMNKQLTATLDGMKAGGEYDLAAKEYRLFLTLRSHTQPYDWYLLTQIYLTKLQDAIDLHQGEKEAYADLDKAYNEFDAKYGYWDQIDILYYYHAAYCTQVLDPEAKAGTAVPLYQKLIDYIQKRKDHQDRWKNMLRDAWSYMAFYSYHQNRIKDTVYYARKVLTVDPNNVNARKIISLR